jgi:hypothetical protein
MRELGLPRKTYDRYWDLAVKDREEEYDYLIENNDVMDYVMVLEECINNARNEIFALARNDKLDPKDKDNSIAGIRESIRLAISLLSLKQEKTIRCGRPLPDEQKKQQQPSSLQP